MVSNFIPIPNIYIYIKLSFIFDKSDAFFCMMTLGFLNVCCGFGSYMQRIFFQAEYSMKIKKFVVFLRINCNSKTSLNMHEVLDLGDY